MKKIVTIAALFALTACAQIGKGFDHTVVDTFKPGVTTKEEVFEALGKPLQGTQVANGDQAYRWAYTVGTPFGATHKEVVLGFHKGVFTRVISASGDAVK